MLFLNNNTQTPNYSNNTNITNNRYIYYNHKLTTFYNTQLINHNTHKDSNKLQHIKHNTRKKLNELQHIKKGNYYINLLHWNKGNTLFKNKTTQIDQILQKYKPHIISLCEANIEKTINNTQNDTYMDYKVEHTKMSNNTNNSRNAILIKNDLIYTRRDNLEDDITSTIWIELRVPEGKIY